MKKTGVCILGMHRSGTSCLAGCLQSAGLQLGEVVEWAPHNVRGNRENLDIRQLNDAVLATSGGAWDNPPATIRWTEHQASTRDAIVEALESLPGPFWGFKDPRAVLTLPFWQDRVRDIRIVATFRNPLAVAESLAARDQMPLGRGLRLWQAYNEKVLSHLAGPLISFDVPREEYGATVRAAAQWLGIAHVDRTDGFFDEALRHHGASAVAGDTCLSPEIDRLHGQLVTYYDGYRRVDAHAG